MSNVQLQLWFHGQSAAKLLTRDEARRIAVNIATSRESDSIGLAGSIDSAAPTARRYQMTRRETPTVFPTIGVFLLLCANKNGPDGRRCTKRQDLILHLRRAISAGGQQFDSW